MINHIVALLIAERDRLNGAIDALQEPAEMFQWKPTTYGEKMSMYAGDVAPADPRGF